MIAPRLFAERVGLVLGVAGVMTVGCGLVEPDVTDFDLTLPQKAFTIDTGSWEVDGSRAETLVMTSCAGSPNVCSTAAEEACEMDCSAACNTSTNTCDLALDIGLYQTVNLVQDRPELKSINDQPVIEVTLDNVTYSIRANSLDVDTPELALYVAPMSITEWDDPEARRIGTIDPIAARTITTSPQPIRFTPGGKEALVELMSTYKTPFNVIVGSQIVIRSGQSVPTGKLDAVIQITAHAGL